MHPTLASFQQGRPGAAPPRPLGRPPQQQARRGLNENYARELLELHTLGVDGGYTQTDVIEVARALTGWTMNPRTGAQFIFRPEIHDAGQKVVLGHVLAAGPRAGGGQDGPRLRPPRPHPPPLLARELPLPFVAAQ